jgi:hypothetical protein
MVYLRTEENGDTNATIIIGQPSIFAEKYHGHHLGTRLPAQGTVDPIATFLETQNISARPDCNDARAD